MLLELACLVLTLFPEDDLDMKLPTYRTVNTLGFLICAALLTYAYYSQFGLGLEPCPLCIFQRVAMIALGITFLGVAVHNPKGWGRRVYAVLLLITAGAGVLVAGRHVWLQHLPADQVPACGPGLGYMLDVFPLTEAIKMAFTGSGECANVDWTFLGLAMPTWVLIWFVVLGVVGIWNSFRRNV